MLEASFSDWAVRSRIDLAKDLLEGEEVTPGGHASRAETGLHLLLRRAPKSAVFP
jgi:hypothetical protein